ncbi:MAG: DUF2764 family protein [Parachlamydiaceae bacterium]|nr:DUF2764 family protein [Parachlamydiaceae bacterium]
MIKKNYYFVATALPPLQIGVPPEISFEEFETLLQDNLTANDDDKTEVIRRFYDIQNIRAFWKNESLDPRGGLNEIELETALLDQAGFPTYVFDFLNRYDSTKSRLEHFPELVSTYFTAEQKHATGFLQDYLRFEREWRLVFTAFRAKQLGRDLTKELQYEDPDEDLVAQILAQKDSKTFIPPNGFQELQPLFEEHSDDPLALYKALCEYRFSKVEEMLDIDLFSIDRLLGYMVQLIIVEKWFELDKQKGTEIVNQIVTPKRE